jgi:hypothetical protein
VSKLTPKHVELKYLFMLYEEAKTSPYLDQRKIETQIGLVLGLPDADLFKHNDE